LKDDPVIAAERKLIESNGLAVYRTAAAWDAAKPKPVSTAVARALNWESEAGRSSSAPRFVYCNIGNTTLAEMARHVSVRLGASALRVTGSGKTPITRVALGPGMGFGSQIMAEVFQDSALDAVITDVVLDVDGGSTYIEDMITAGRRIGMIQTGCDRFEYPVAAEVARWARTLFPGMKVDLAPDSEPFWLA
jgi:hypothetical protein